MIDDGDIPWPTADDLRDINARNCAQAKREHIRATIIGQLDQLSSEELCIVERRLRLRLLQGAPR